VRASDNFVAEHDDGSHRESVDVEALLGFDQHLDHQFLAATVKDRRISSTGAGSSDE
jgi:hypothetical protein